MPAMTALPAQTPLPGAYVPDYRRRGCRPAGRQPLRSYPWSLGDRHRDHRNPDCRRDGSSHPDLLHCGCRRFGCVSPACCDRACSNPVPSAGSVDRVSRRRSSEHGPFHQPSAPRPIQCIHHLLARRLQLLHHDRGRCCAHEEYSLSPAQLPGCQRFIEPDRFYL